MKQAIILAAGRGTRMNIDYPKCGYPVFGKPMINYITSELNKCNLDKIIIVVGFMKEYIIDITDRKYEYAFQSEQLGTGHAVYSAEKNAFKEGITIIVPGDMPFVDSKLIQTLIEYHEENSNDLTVVTFFPNDLKRYGKIKRENRKIIKIIEFEEMEEEDKEIKEVNSGLFAVNSKVLFDLLPKLSKHEKKGEYYITDLVEIMNDGYRVDSFITTEYEKLVGINDLITIKELESNISLITKTNPD